MNNMLTATLVQRTAAVNGWLLGATRDLSDEQLTRWLAPDVPSAGWHLWHIARWADRVHALLPVMIVGSHQLPEVRGELWELESLASQWGFDTTILGYGQTGMEMADKAAASLVFPSKDVLLDYARRAFAATEAVFGAIEDHHCAVRGPDLLYAGRLDRQRSVCEAVVAHVSHASRHLGTIEGIRALLLRKPGSMTF